LARAAFIRAATLGGTVRLWDPQSGEQRLVLEGHQGTVYAVCAVTIDGRDLLASCSDDDTVRVWDLQTSACVLTMPTHYDAWGWRG
jgi:WD40 repeat protein